MFRRFIFFPFVAMLGLAAVFAACGDDDDKAADTPGATTAAATATTSGTAGAPTEAEARTFMEDLVDTYNGGDIDGFLNLFSDEGLNSFIGDDPGTSRAQAEADAKDNLAGNTITIHEVTEKSSTGDTITVNVATDNGITLQSEDFTLEKAEGGLVIAAYERLEAEIPDDTTAVTVEGTEYQYIFDDAPITDGNIAFTFSNIGSQLHEMYLLKVDDTPLQQIVDDALAVTDPTQLPPEILDDIGPTVAPPGQSSTFVPVNPLDSGRYVMMCFIPDESDQAPHASKGMFAEFTVP